MKVIRKLDSRVFLDGPEVCREYVVTPKITFGSSTLQPGQTGGIDPGHPNGHEVFSSAAAPCSCTTRQPMNTMSCMSRISFSYMRESLMS